MKTLSILLFIILSHSAFATEMYLKKCQTLNSQSQEFKNDLSWLKYLWKTESCETITKNLSQIKSLSEVLPATNTYHKKKSNSWIEEMPFLYGIYSQYVPPKFLNRPTLFSQLEDYKEFKNIIHLPHIDAYEALGHLSLCQKLEKLPSINIVTVDSPLISDEEDQCLLDHQVKGLIIRNEVSETLEKFPRTMIIGLEHFSGRASDLKAFVDLKYLHIGQVDMSSKGIEAIGGLNNLIHLSLESTGLRNLDFIKYFHNLTSLTIACEERNNPDYKENCLNKSTLSDLHFLKDLRWLKRLNISDVNLKHIGEIKNLKRLQKVVLSGNQIKDISGLASLESLEFLDISNNNLESIETLAEFKNLKYLNLSHNKLSRFDTISKLKNLVVLNVSANNKTRDLTSLRPSSSLKVLSLNGSCVDQNKIQLFGTDSMTSLSGVNLQSSSLYEDGLKNEFRVEKDVMLFEGMGSPTSWQSVRDINCQADPFLVGHVDLSHLETIEILSLRYNRLNTIPSLVKLSMLKYVDLEGNEVSNLTNLPHLNLEVIDLSFNNFKLFPDLTKFKGLNKIDLIGNTITEIKNISSIPNSHATVELSGNLIKDPSALGSKLARNLNVTIVGNPIHSAFCKKGITKKIPAIEEYCSFIN